MLPGMNGLEICRQLRAKPHYSPILMLTAKAEEIDKIIGLETGADDYLTKPFSVREFISRVKAIFRRVQLIRENLPAGTHRPVLHANGLLIDGEKRKVTVQHTRISLTPKEFDLLYLLLPIPAAATPGKSCCAWCGDMNSTATNTRSTPTSTACGQKLKKTLLIPDASSPPGASATVFKMQTEQPYSGSDSIRHSLYWRISLALLVLFFLLGISFMIITTYPANRYYEETSQKLNARVAMQMLEEVPPFVNGKVNGEALGKIMHSMMAVNPSLEVYLLDTTGRIITYVVLDKKVKLRSVSLSPIRQFLQTEGTRYIRGDNPRNPKRETIFSAAPVRQDGRLLGYVYMVLASEEYETISASLWDSYILRIGTWSFFLVLVAAFAIGLAVLWWLTRNLRKIRSTVRAFEAGDLSARIPVTSRDELAALSQSINRMADTIVQNMEELRQVDTLRKELVANISHDLRTPLSVIHGYVETLSIKQNQLSAADQQKYTDIILRSTDKLKRLVNDLFELSKLEARQVSPQLQVFSVQKLLQDVAGKYQLLAHQKEVGAADRFYASVAAGAG
jgi:CheY-like chemotaxis protein